MKFIKDLDKARFESFVVNHQTKSHFLQSSHWGEFSHSKKQLVPHYVGLIDDDDNVAAAALLLEKKMPFGYCYLYSPRGYVLDYNDKKLLEEFTVHIKGFAKSKKAIFVKIDPDIQLQALDTEGNVIDEEPKNFHLVEYLKKLGFVHTGFNKNFENNQPRYTFRLSLEKDIQEIYNSFHATTRKILNRGNQYNLEFKINNIEDIEDFHKTMQDTEKRDDIINHGLSYYREFFSYLHKHNMSDLYIATVNIKKLKATYHDKLEALQKELENTETNDKYKNEEKKKNLQSELNNQINRAKKDLENIESIKEKEIPLTGIISAKYNDKVWTVHGGNNNLLRELNANYLIYYEIIKNAKEEGYKTIDFFGTTGDPKESNPVYGIHLFKKRLGGKYIEFIGEFDLVTNKFMYFIFTKLIPMYRKIKRIFHKNRKD